MVRRIGRHEHASELIVALLVTAGAECGEPARELNHRKHRSRPELQADAFSIGSECLGGVLFARAGAS
jgi:hypothetical protein